jgi:hypothetical protein
MMITGLAKSYIEGEFQASSEDTEELLIPSPDARFNERRKNNNLRII